MKSVFIFNISLNQLFPLLIFIYCQWNNSILSLFCFTFTSNAIKLVMSSSTTNTNKTETLNQASNCTTDNIIYPYHGVCPLQIFTFLPLHPKDLEVNSLNLCNKFFLPFLACSENMVLLSSIDEKIFPSCILTCGVTVF